MLWGAILLFTLITVFAQHKPVVRLSSDLMSLLPATEQDHAAAEASAAFANTFSRWVGFVVSSPDRGQARAAAEFLEEKLNGSGYFQSIMGKTKKGTWAAIGADYFPWRFGLLADQYRGLSDEALGQQLISDAYRRLASPVGMMSSQQLVFDPLSLMPSFFLALSHPTGNLKQDDGMMTGFSEGQYHILVSGLLKPSSLALSQLGSAVESIQQVSTAVTDTHTDTSVLTSGMPFYMNAGATSARQEVSTIGLGSILGIVFLLLLVFRSVKPLVLCLVSIGTGVAFGYLVTTLLFGSVHLVTLVFGASLIGVSIDYTFHYLVEWRAQGQQWKPLQGLKHIMPGITLGLVTSVIGYVPMVATPFPGLQQIAVFSSAGLIWAWLTVVLVYPFFLPAASTARGNTTISPWLLSGTGFVLSFWERVLAARKTPWLLLLVLALSSGSVLLTTNDDIRQLQSRPAQLVANDEAMGNITGNLTENRFFLVRGDTEEQLLQRVESLSRSLQTIQESGVLAGFQSITSVLPSLTTQQQNYRQLMYVYKHTLPSFWEQLGVPAAQQRESQKQFDEVNGHWLTPEVWKKNPITQFYGHLWLGQHEGQYFSAVLLSGVKGAEMLLSLESLPGVSFVDKTGDTSELFGRYRELMSALLALAYAVITLLLMRRYGAAGALRVVFPPLSAGLLTLSLLGIAGQSINLFHILALIMVLGIGIDYTVFFREAGANRQYTFVAITLSALTTLLSFGLLSLSETAAIHGFGVTVLTGICFSYLLSPFAMKTEEAQ